MRGSLVHRIPLPVVNAYLVGEPGGGAWALVDTGLPGSADKIREAAEARYGKASRPEAIYLTHGHADHAGSARELAEFWDVPIYAHWMELPYLTGRSDYPPLDPTTGGAMATLVPFLSAAGRDLRPFVQPLPEGGLPGLPGWQAVYTPGHSPGHVAFFHAGERFLLAGDACATLDADRWKALLTGRQKLVRPAGPTTPDWVSARKSLKTLGKLRPLTIACGHGVPMRGQEMAGYLESLAEEFIIPLKGRYVSDPARFDESGITYLPPAPTDTGPLNRRAKLVAGLGVAAAGTLWVGAGVYLAARKRKGTGNA